MKNLTKGRHGVFSGLNFESDAEMGKKVRFSSATKKEYFFLSEKKLWKAQEEKKFFNTV
jgi:hypothetical protein